ncbi:MAG: hypothetical protein UD961_12405 [Bacteroidales bacterium]|nr:hypothetical protein [Bacteroidales bacterium]
MNESRIIKSIKFHAIKHLLNGEYWQVDKLFAYAAAIIYPFVDQVKFDNQSGTIKNLVKILTKFLRNSKSGNLELLSFDGLVCFFISEFCPTINYSIKKECLSESITLIASINEDGFISWGGKTEVYNSIVNIYEKDAYLHEYGVESYYITKDDDNSTNSNKSFSSKEIIKTPMVKKERKYVTFLNKETEEEKVLNQFWREKIFGEHYKECMPYVWKLQISNSLYRELKEILHSAFKVVKQSVLLDNHSEKIFVYVAEWFKWEYQPGSQNNAFTDLGIRNISGKLWESLNKWQDFRYSGEANDINLYSIYALGGFPLLAILKSDRIDSLFECLLHEDDPDVLIESLLRVIPGLSDAFRQSLADNEDGSWSRYIQAMIDQPEMLYADCDKCTNEFVKHFYERLENGRRESVVKAIKHNWIFYTAPDSEEITGDIILNIGKDNSAGCVSAEIIKSEVDLLYIGIECQDEIVNYRKYSKTRDCKRFIGWGTTSNRIRGYIEDLSQTIHLCKYNTELLQPSEGETITAFELGNKYIEVYATDDGSGWTTLREFKKNTKAVLFPSDVYDIIGNTSTIQNKIIGNSAWSLCEILEVVQLIEKGSGKIYNLYQEGEITVRVTPRTDIIKYCDTSRSLIKCLINGQEEYYSLMMGIPTGKSIKIYPNKSKEDNFSVKFKDSNVKAEYTQNRQRKILDNNETFGIISLDLNAKNNGVVYSYNNKYFFIPSNCIQRDVLNNKIIFNNLSGRKVSRIQHDDTEISLETNYYVDDGSIYQHDDTIKFRIYDTDTDYLEVDIYRPILYRELNLNGNVIKRYNDTIQGEQKISLPYILRNKFSLRIFGKEGVNYITNFRNIRWFNLGQPQYTSRQCDEFDIYLYANRQVKGEKIGTLDIGSKGIDQYKFYYWDVSNETKPCIIETSYDNEKQRLIIPTECLKNGGMIFQSLNGCCPRHYVTPIYAKTHWTLLTNPVYSDNIIYKCFKTAVEHKVPFTQFYPLHRAVMNTTTLRALYDNFMSDKNLCNTEGYVQLHRFSNEFSFEWILLPQSFWRKVNKQQAIKFLQHSCFIQNSADRQLLRRLVDIYLNIKLQDGIQVRKQNIAKTFRYMRGMKKDPQIIPVSDESVETIKCLYESSEWINDLLVVLENK